MNKFDVFIKNLIKKLKIRIFYNPINFYYLLKKKYYFQIEDIEEDEFIFYSHLGLGDQIILNGLINVLSESFKKIYLITNNKFKNNAKYLYRNNKKIDIYYLSQDLDKFDQSYPRYQKEVIALSDKINKKILRVGYNQKDKKIHFSKAFYKQLNIDFDNSYSEFKIDSDLNKEEILLQELRKYYQVTEDFILVHNEHSTGILNLNKIDNKNIIYVSKDSDPFNNIFLYKKIIQEAKEIHCINSSFVHLVDRINTNAELFYHNIIGSFPDLRKEWKQVNY